MLSAYIHPASPCLGAGLGARRGTALAAPTRLAAQRRPAPSSLHARCLRLSCRALQTSHFLWCTVLPKRARWGFLQGEEGVGSPVLMARMAFP